MSKNPKSGARAPKNYDPRYGERKKATKQSIGRSHRGYVAPVEGDAPKKARWSADDRAGRDQSRTIHDRASGRTDRAGGRTDRAGHADRAGYGDRAGHADRAGRTDRAGHGDRNDRGNRFDRNDRAGQSERFSRPDRNDRSSDRGYSRDDRAPRGPVRDRNDGGATRGFVRPDRADRNDRTDRNNQTDRTNRGYGARDGGQARAGGQGYDRERPVFRDGSRGRFNSDDRSPRTERTDRPTYADRSDRSARTDRPRFDVSERSRFGRDDRTDRPRVDRTDRADRTDRPAFNRNDRTDRTDRPAFNRNDRTDRTDRTDRPRFETNDRPRFGGADRAERTGDRDLIRAERARGDRSDWNKGSDWSKDSKKSFEQQEDTVRERLDAKTVSADDVATVTFDDLGLGQNIVRVLRELGADKPFPIQAATIPDILAGRDTLGRGRTGSGKTIAFGAPLVEALLRSRDGIKREFGRKPSAIILAPTRELALQLDRTIQPIARSVGLFTTQIYGGVPQGRQVGALQKGVDIIIGTPGRIEDLIQQRKLDLSEVKFAVLDEADHMCELGFLEPVQRILRKTQAGSQKLLFSATLDAEVEALVNEFLVNPAVYEVAGEDQDSGTIEHRVLVVDHRDKADILTSLVDRAGKTLVFTRTRAYAEMLTEQFEDAGISAVALHGDLNQAKRTRNLHKMTSGRVDVLVATDVAARGIHVDDIDLVIQADAPDEYKTYMHRSGRTGRAGNSGRVVTLIPRQRRRRMTELLDRAEIGAPFDDARAGDEIIDEISGRTPTLADITA